MEASNLIEPALSLQAQSYLFPVVVVTLVFKALPAPTGDKANG